MGFVNCNETPIARAQNAHYPWFIVYKGMRGSITFPKLLDISRLIVSDDFTSFIFDYYHCLGVEVY